MLREYDIQEILEFLYAKMNELSFYLEKTALDIIVDNKDKELNSTGKKEYINRLELEKQYVQYFINRFRNNLYDEKDIDMVLDYISGEIKNGDV